MTTSAPSPRARLARALPLALLLAAGCAPRRRQEVALLPTRTVPPEMRCAGITACVRRDVVEVRADSIAASAEPLLVDVLEAVAAGRRAYADLLGGTPAPIVVRLAATNPDSNRVRREAGPNGALTIVIPVGTLPRNENPVVTRSILRRARWEAADAWLATWRTRVLAIGDTNRTPVWVRAGLLALLSDVPRAREAHLRYQSEDRLPLRDLPPNVQLPAPPAVVRADARRGRGDRGERSRMGPGGGAMIGMMIDPDGEGLRLPLAQLAVAQAASVLTFLERTVSKQAFLDLVRRLAAGEPLPAALRATPGAPDDVDALDHAWSTWLKSGG